MASDRSKYKRALKKWDAHIIDRNYSLPAGEGVAAILCVYPLYSDKEEGKVLSSTPIDLKETKIFRNEALAIADRLARRSGQLAEVALNASFEDFNAVLSDPNVSDVVVIGHGILPCVDIRYGDDSVTTFDWYDVARAADHLKLGQFVQRTCGLIGWNVSVPLGTFSVADHRNVIAPVGMFFEPRGLDHSANQLLTPVSDEARMSYEYVKETFAGNATD